MVRHSSNCSRQIALESATLFSSSRARKTRIVLAVILPIALLLLMFAAMDPAWLQPASAAGTVRYVAPDAACNGPTSCYSTIQAAVDVAQVGDEIRVAQGVYTDIHVVSAITQVVYVSKSLILRGGYSTSDWTNNYITRSTVLNAQGAGRAIYIASNVTATIEGFSITGGTATEGGGIYLAAGNSVIQNNMIYNSQASSAGGGIYVASGNATVRGNTLYSNTAGTRGGGIIVSGGSATIEGNNIYGNVTTGGADGLGDGGGGIYAYDCAPIIRSNTVYNNVAAADGGGINLYGPFSGGAVVERNAIYHNGGYLGGGLYIREQSHTVRNNLVYSNTQGSGFYFRETSSIVENNTLIGNTSHGIDNVGGFGGVYPTLRNNIVINSTGYGIHADGAVNVTYSDVWGNTGGDFAGALSSTGTIMQNPLLTSDFHLQSASPAIDAADPINFASNDYAGYARPFGSHADMGAYEYYSGDCFARLNGGQVYTTVQAAVNAARLTTDTISVAGICTGVETVIDGGQTLTQTVYLSKPLTLRGGYAETNWTAPMTLTILDAQGQGRVIYITGTLAITVDGFVVRNGNAALAGNGTFGGGLYIASALNPTIQNVIFYSNTAEYGGGLSLVGGSAGLFNNTFVSNTATNSNGGGGLYLPSGSPVVSNTIVVSNTNGGIWASINARLAYNDVWNNSGNDYAGPATAGPHSLWTDPSFVNSAAADFHLAVDSPLIHAGDPGTTVQTDLEGDHRPLGSGYDIGADEVAVYPNVVLTDSVLNDIPGMMGQFVVYTHTLINNGTLLSDTFILSHSLTVLGQGTGWSVDYDTGDISLLRNESRQVLVTVTVGNGFSGTTAIVDLRAASLTNPNVYDTVSDRTLLDLTTGLSFTPVTYTQDVNPGQWITFAHTLRNLGNSTESFRIDWVRDPDASKSGIDWIRVPTSPVTVGPFTQTTALVSMFVPRTLPGGIAQMVVLTATSAYSEALHAVLTDSIVVNYTVGPRYVAGTLSSAKDDLNNCQVKDLPCKTIAHAVGQAANGDQVNVAQGIYSNEPELLLNKDITLRGGYSTNFKYWNPKAYLTVVDAGERNRVMNIFGNPTVEGFTLQNGMTNGSGGGVWISLGAPVLRNNVIISNTAGQYGGGIYNDNMLGGIPRLEQNLLAFNQAGWGGGFANAANSPVFWNNLVYANQATSGGGGVYVSGGVPQLWHDTIFGNTAVITGGGAYLGGGTPSISNTIVAGNSAVTAGGIYSQTPGALLDYNDVWGNTPADATNWGAHSLAIDPSFMSTKWNDLFFLHLQMTSPLTGTAQPSVVNQDYWGNPRPLDGKPEIGADEIMVVAPVLTPGRSDADLPGRVLTFTHVLTNNGNYVDTYSLAAEGSLGWPLTLVPPLTVTLGMGQSSLVTVTVTLPATAISSTVNTVIVTATSGNEMSIWATAVNTVTVRQTVGIVVDPNLAAVGTQGNPVVYTHVVTNAGNYTETVVPGYTNNCDPAWSGWPIVFSPPVLTVPAFSTRTLSVVITVPTGVPGTPVYVNTTVITVSSQYSPTASDQVTDTTYVNRTFGLKFTPDLQGSGPPLYSVPYTHTITNTGNYTDTFVFTLTTAAGWSVYGVDHVTLGHGEARQVRFDITPPAKTPSDTVVATLITAASEFTPSVRATVVDTTTVGPSPGLTLSKFWPCPQTIGWCVVSRTSGQDAWYGFELTNDGNLNDTFDITAVTTNSFPVDVNPASVTLAPNQKTVIWVIVHVPWMSQQLDDRVDVTATSRTNPRPAQSAYYTTRINWWVDLTWDPPIVDSHVFAGNQFVYTRTLVNTGEESTGVGFDWLHSSSSWTLDINPPGLPSGSLAPGASQTFWFTVTVLPEATSPRSTLEITATATDICFARTWAWDDFEVARMTLGPDIARTAPPSMITEYNHVLRNAGAVSDTYTISWTHASDWLVTVTPTLVSNLQPGETRMVTATVAVPFVLSGTVDSPLIITARSTTYPSAIWDTATDTTTVGYSARAVVSPDWSDTKRPGDMVTYTHSLTNTGNYTETFSFTTIISGSGYSTVLTPTTPVTLGPGQSLDGVQVVVILNPDAILGETVRSQITAVFADQQQAAAVDSVSVVVEPGPRYVAPGGGMGNCLSQNNPCATVKHAFSQVMPGDTIYVAQGTYTDTLVLNKSMTLRGGYAASNWNVTPDPWGQASVLDVQGQGRVISISSILTAPLTVEGFKIMGGNASGGDGGGVYVNTTQPVTLSANIFYNNTAANGGAVFVRLNGDLRLYNSFIYSNTATSNGGGVCLSGSTANVINNTLVANRASTNGAALFLATGTATIQNSIFASNVNVGGGGSVVAGGTTPGNTNDGWNNSPATLPPGWSNTLSDNPLFKDAASGDLHLTPNSPLINSTSSGPGTDIDYDVRPQLIPNGRTATPYDIGADEYAWVQAVAFAPPLGRQANKSSQVVFTHLMTNAGSYTDTINLAAAFDRSDGTVQVSRFPSELAAGQSATVWVTVTWTTLPPLNAVGTAYITATSALNPSVVVGTAMDVITYQDRADVQIDKSVTPAGVLGPGAFVTYRLAYSNLGPADATGVVITDIVPTMLTNVNWVSSGPALTARGGAQYVWDVGTLASGSSGAITVTGNISQPAGTVTDLVNTATIATTAIDPTPGNNSDTVTNTVHIPSVSIVKQATPSNPVMGTPFTYTLFVNNVGPTMNGAVITDVVPANAYYISGGSQSGGTVTWSGLSIGSAAQVSFVVSTCQSSVTNASYGVSSSNPQVSVQGAPVQTPIVAPSIVVSFTYSAGTLVGSPVYLTGTASTDGRPIVAWSWNLGDGTTASGPAVSHSYSGAGPYNVTLTVTDACGIARSASRSVTAGGVPAGLNELRVGPVGTQTSGVAFTLVVTAYDGAGNVLTNYSGQATLTDSTGTIQPTTFSNWVNGVARPQVTINVAQPFNGDVITVTSLSISGSSNPFDVVLNPLGTVWLVADPTAISVGRSAFLTATVLGGDGQPVSGTLVTFTAMPGIVAPQVATTAVGGKAYAVFTGTAAGTAVLTATIGSGSFGNATVAVSQGRYIYLPTVMNNYAPGKNLMATSIVATPTNLAATSVTIRNTGDVAVTEEFWVVLYVDPTSPVQVNKFWWEVGSTKGISWRVTTPIPAGQTLTLTASGSYVDAARTSWPPTLGTHTLWVQADAYGGPFGLVKETNESDNIYGPVPLNVP